MTQAHRLDPLLRPRSVAVLGASTKPVTVGYETLLNLEQGGFPGAVYAVNPRYDALGDRRCYRSLGELPERPELVIFAIADRHVEAALNEAIALGVKAVYLMGPLVVDEDLGADSDPDNNLRARVAKRLREASMLACGANGMGFYNFRDRVWACGFETRAHHLPGNVAFLSQSGSGMCGILDCDSRIDFNFAVSTGQELNLTLADYLDFALDLPETRVVGLFIESIHDVPAFTAALGKAAAKKIPLIAIKTGKTRDAARLAVSHSGRLAGDDAAYSSLFERYGVQRVSDMDELAAALILHAADGPLGAGGLVSLHDSGGEQQLLADLAADYGVPLTTLAAETVAELKAFLDPEIDAVNPLDGWSRGGPEAATIMKQALAALSNDPNAACAALVHDRGPHGQIYGDYEDYLRHARSRCDTPLALVASHQGSDADPAAERITRELGIPVLDGISTYLAALRTRFGYRDFLKRPVIAAPGVTKRTVDRWRRALARQDRCHEAEALPLLGAAGIAVARNRLVDSAADAAAFAREAGMPIALKTAVDGLVHKTDAGGVILNINNPTAARRAYRELTLQFGPQVLAAVMAPPGVEMLLGMTRDRELGPVVVVGFGGVYAEVLNDVATALPPFDAPTARRLIDTLRLRPLLDGVRGQPAADVGALERAAARFSALVSALGEELAEIDINPLIVHAKGCTAVDAYVRGRQATDTTASNSNSVDKRRSA